MESSGHQAGLSAFYKERSRGVEETDSDSGKCMCISVMFAGTLGFISDYCQIYEDTGHLDNRGCEIFIPYHCFSGNADYYL